MGKGGDWYLGSGVLADVSVGKDVLSVVALSGRALVDIDVDVVGFKDGDGNVCRELYVLELSVTSVSICYGSGGTHQPFVGPLAVKIRVKPFDRSLHIRYGCNQ